MNAPSPVPTEVAPTPTTSRPQFGPRVTPNNLHDFGGIWRLSIRRFFSPGRWLMLAGMLVLLVLFSIPAAANRDEAARNFLSWVARFYICFLVPVMAFLSAAGTVRDDLQAGAVDYLFTRPVRRPVFLCLRYVTHVICTQVDFLFAFAVVVGIGAFHQVPDFFPAVPWLFLAQFLAILAFSGFGFLCAMLTSRYVIIGLLYGVFIEVGMGNVPTQLSHLSMGRQILSVLAPVLRGERGGGSLFENGLSAPAAAVLLLGTSLVMLGVAALVFGVREPAGAAGRE
jgi:ABC-2 type transport system permease protein